MSAKLRLALMLIAASVVAWGLSLLWWCNRGASYGDGAEWFVPFAVIVAVVICTSPKEAGLRLRLVSGVIVGGLLGLCLKPGMTLPRAQIVRTLSWSIVWSLEPTGVLIGGTVGGIIFLFWPEFSNWLNRVNNRVG